MSAPYLFSVDLEDPRSSLPDGERYPERVPANVERLLEFLRGRRARCTFFTVGDVARRYPSLVAEIAAEGHEVACHSSDHVPLERLGRSGLRDDLERNRDDLARAGAGPLEGFRAPLFSLTPATRWAHDVLAELGFAYSSSVLPARGPHYGWAGYGTHCRREHGVWEIPITVGGWPLRLPFGGGVCFRALPAALVSVLFRRTLASGRPVVGYFHPYDVDADRERHAHPCVNGNPLHEWLMYRNRDRVLPRLRGLLERDGLEIRTYAEFVAGLDAHEERPGARSLDLDAR